MRAPGGENKDFRSASRVQRQPDHRAPGSGAPRARRTVGIGESLEILGKRLDSAPAGLITRVFSSWEEAVGQPVALHVWPERIDGDLLIVAVDSPAWASHLRTVAATILKQLDELAGPGTPTRLTVRVRAGKQPSDQEI
jgi:predicted nucleic acid-binding Zn ribbon protein